MPARILIACLLSFASLAAPAAANHRHPDGEEPVWQEPAPEAQEPAAEEQAPVQPAEETWPDEPEPARQDETPWPDQEWPGEDRRRWPDHDEPELPPLVKGRAVTGKVARMRADGRAAVPLGAPVRVRRLVSALNEIVGKPYKWGGGHGALFDRGYDCSGAVSYGLRRTGLLGYALTSGGFARWASGGKGRWVTIYANSGHAYLEVAGLRLDTSSVGDFADGRDGVRWRPAIGQRRGFRARHVAGL